MSFQAALAAAAATARQAAGADVTIKRPGKQPIVGVRAGKGKSAFDAQDGDGVITRIETLDWLIDPADYDFGDGPVEPQRGDTIEEVDGNKKYTFDLYAPDKESVWRWSDGFRTQRRVHSQLINTQ